ncbi:hypothetical protein D3C72_2219820 [compost metagenome]
MNDFEQRLLATAQVRALAVEIREDAAEAAERIASKTAQTFNRIAWNASNPVIDFVPRALDEFMKVSDIIRSHAVTSSA